MTGDTRTAGALRHGPREPFCRESRYCAASFGLQSPASPGSAVSTIKTDARRPRAIAESVGVILIPGILRRSPRGGKAILTNWPSVWMNRPGEHIKSPGPSDRQRVRGRTSHRRGVMDTRPAPEAPGGYKARQIPIRGKKQNPPALTSRRACGSDARVCDNRPAVWPTLCARLVPKRRLGDRNRPGRGTLTKNARTLSEVPRGGRVGRRV